MTRKFNISIGEFYHIYNRGNSKSNIFRDKADIGRFQKLLFVSNNTNPVVFKEIQSLALDKIKRGEALVDIGVYCLMGNHFHLLVREKIENGTSIFMQKLLTSYSKYFNKKYGRIGTLFEGPFKATHADTDEYLKYLFAYIHLNPIKIIDPEWKENGIADYEEAKNYLARYSYSSYLDYMGTNRIENSILNKPVFPDYFSNFKEFSKFIDEWLSFTNRQSEALAG